MRYQTVVLRMPVESGYVHVHQLFRVVYVDPT